MPATIIQSTGRTDYGTPQYLFDWANRRWGPFDLDVCASKWNAKCAAYYTIEDDAMTKRWHGRCWMNPPYTRAVKRLGIQEEKIEPWIEKAVTETELQAVLGCCLLPVRTQSAWFHELVLCYASELCWIRGRIAFDCGHPMVIQRPNADHFFAIFKGECLDSGPVNTTVCLKEIR